MSVDNETEKICHRWIVEYEFWRMWNRFSKSDTVCEWHGNSHPENFGDRKTHGYRLLIHFMCKIAEAANEVSVTKLSTEVVAAAETMLEEAISLLDYISHAFTRLESVDIEEVKLCLRRYAVLAPLHKNDQTTAKVHKWFFC